jgi:RHS repeat-associated protein
VDGDGNRVKGTVGSTTTVYIGNYFEWTGSTMKKYYYQGSFRVAMRTGTSSPQYLLSDHLGSTEFTLSSSGTKQAELRYKAWGETRYTYGSTPTTFRYTGQRQESSLGGVEGLYYYGARWYDSSLGRFNQADTIVPDPYNPLDWDRYSYVRNNPVRYTDPSGHCIGVLAIVCVVVGGILLFGLLPGDSRIYESSPSQDPVLQLLLGLTLLSGGGGFPTLGRYLMQDGDPSNEIVALNQSTSQNANISTSSVTLSEEMVQSYAGISTINPTSQEVVLGLYRNGQGYTAMAEARGASYLNMPADLYSTITSTEFWKVNQQFLQNAINKDKIFILETPFSEAIKLTSTYLYQELIYLLSHGYEYVVEDGVEKLVPK